MQSSEDSSMQIINNYNAVRLLINVYLIRKIKSANKPVNQEKFIDSVRKEFKNRNYNYPRKRILHTWKYLLDNYQFYKGNFIENEAQKVWIYFNLMDNCFENSKQQTSEKFQDSRWTFFLIESLSKYKSAVLHHGLTMDILQAVEDDFQRAQNFNINQKDIHNQWTFLKRFFRQNQNTGYYKQLAKNHAYFEALKTLFEPERPIEIEVDKSELVSAIESTEEENITEVKKKKTDSKVISETKNSDELPEESFITENIHESWIARFTIVMHDILLQCFKRHKTKIQNLNGNIDDDILKEAFEEFQKLGYDVTRQSISDEWNDLSCRYELIKNIKQPEKWPYYSDMNYIYNNKDTNEGTIEEDQDNQSTIGSIIVENLRKTQNLKHNDYVELTERLLNVYESNSKEFLEIKDILVERNLLREETNYLLNMFVEKFNNKNRTKNFTTL